MQVNSEQIVGVQCLLIAQTGGIVFFFVVFWLMDDLTTFGTKGVSRISRRVIGYHAMRYPVCRILGASVP